MARKRGLAISKDSIFAKTEKKTEAKQKDKINQEPLIQDAKKEAV